MTEVYSITTDFGGVTPNSNQLVTEITDSAIATAVTRIDRVGDTINIVFVSTISAGDKTTLDGLVGAHVPAVKNVYPDIYIKPGESIPRFDKDATTYNLYGKYSKEILISKETQGDYTTIKDAVTNNNTPGMIFRVYPGTYNEDNPITLPANSLLMCSGITPQAIINANNPNSDLIVLSAWSKLSCFILNGSNGTGSRGVYFDGSVNGTGSYALVSECIIKDCDIGIETANGPDTLLCQSSQVTSVYPGSTLSKGVNVHSGGKFIVISSLSVVGIPSPPAPSAVPITDGFYCTGTGSKMTLNNCGVHYCTHGVTIDNDGEVEASLLGTTYNNTGLCITSTGTKSKLRADLFRMENTITYDIDIQSTQADIDLFSSELNIGKINNPNSVRLAGKFHGSESNTHFLTTTGDLRFGSKKEKTTMSMGQGKYDNEGIIVLCNDNLEVGTWTDNTSDSQIFDGNTFNLFSSTAIGNCVYIGREDSIQGAKFSITTATSSSTPKEDIMWEYWDGSAWTEFKVMTTEKYQPGYHKDDTFISYADKLHCRFGLKSNANFVDKSLNGISKKWVRIRVVNTLSSNPVCEYVKLHTSETKINPDGFIEHFGDSRNIKILNWTINDTEPANASPSNQDLFLSDQLGVGRIENKFANGAVDRLGLNVFLPKDIDTSFPVKLKFAFIGSSGTDGDVEFTCRWNTTNSGSSIYRTTSAAPSSSTGEKSNNAIITVTDADVEYRGEIELDLNDVNPNPSSGTSHLLWISFERDATGGNANDTYPGSISIIQMSPFYISWREGGHINEF